MDFYALRARQNGTSLTATIYALPLVVGGTVFGTPDNPYTGIYMDSGYSSGATYYEMHFRTPNGVTPTISYYRESGGTLPSTSAHYYPWAYMESSTSWNYATKVAVGILEGRYKVKSSLSTPASLNECFINIDCTITIDDEITQCFGIGGDSSSGGTLWVLPKGKGYSTGNRINLVFNGSVSRRPVIEFSKKEVPSTFITFLNTLLEPVYSNEYTIKNNDGSNILATLSEAPPMTKVSLTSVENIHRLNLTGINGSEYSLSWESEPPQGTKFTGLAFDANSGRPSIAIDASLDVTWNDSLQLYEVNGIYRPPLTTFDINLYQNSAEVNRVNKSDYLESVGTISGALRESCSIMSPSITFKQVEMPIFNYVYIPVFSRYYFVTEITSISKNIWRMSLGCDVLMSWKNEIGGLYAVIARQENSFNVMLNDTELPAQSNQQISVTEFPAGGFGTSESIEYPYVLTVVGA